MLHKFDNFNELGKIELWLWLFVAFVWDKNLLDVTGMWVLAAAVLGSKVERVKKSRVMKTRRAQIEMVDWALVRMRLELLRLKEVEPVRPRDDLVVEDGEEEDAEPGERARSLLVGEALGPGVLSRSSSSSGKKTRRRPMPRLSVLVQVLFCLALAELPIPLLLFFLGVKSSWVCSGVWLWRNCVL